MLQPERWQKVLDQNKQNTINKVIIHYMSNSKVQGSRGNKVPNLQTQNGFD